MNQHTLQAGIRAFRRVVVGTVGGTVVLIGLALLVLPGPAFVVLPVGFAILGIEFAWARRWLRRLRKQVQAMAGSSSEGPPADASDDAGSPGADAR